MRHSIFLSRMGDHAERPRYMLSLQTFIGLLAIEKENWVKDAEETN